MCKLKWHTEKRKVKELIQWDKNPRKISETQKKQLKKSLEKFNLMSIPVINTDNLIISGHQRVKVLSALGRNDEEIDVRIPNRKLTENEIKEANIRENKNTGEFDYDLLGGGEFELDMLADVGFDDGELSLIFPEEEKEITEDDVPDANEVESIAKLGDIWQLGKHRLMCADCTVNENAVLLMDNKTSILLHADPPYGMGKEKDGVVNDNLYSDKLDKFQMSWFNIFRPFLENNASVYIWGNAEDLWRLWYSWGLKDLERLTLRNEIVWDKEYGQGILNDDFRCYPPVSERCLFFMLGEQGFNTNADNYWDGWETIRSYLEQERIKAGWDIPAMKRAVGHSDLSGDHWTCKSQWSFPTADVYKKLQQASNSKAFQREYDELKQEYDELKKEFYSTRAYFDNSHDKMTDVWQYPRVKGDERLEHATPKPVEMIARIIKSSSPKKSIIIEPFLGSGSTLIACEQTDRICYGMEIEPKYVSVVILRWLKFMVNNGKEGEIIFKCNGETVDYQGFKNQLTESSKKSKQIVH